MAGGTEATSANAAIASARRDANRVIDSVINNLNNLMNENRPRSRDRSLTPAATQPTGMTRSTSVASNASIKTAKQRTPYRSRFMGIANQSSETPAARSPFLQTAEEKTAGYPTARTASFHGTASEHTTPVRTAIRDNSAFSDTSAGSERVATALSPTAQMQQSRDEDRRSQRQTPASTDSRRARSPTIRVNRNSQAASQAQTTTSPFSRGSARSTTPHSAAESVVTARPLIVRDEITMDALRKGRLFGASKSPAPVPSTTTGVRAPSTARSQPLSTARSQSQEARTAAAIGTPCGRTTGAPAQPEVATTAARTSSAERPADNTAILHGPSGLAIIAIPDTAVQHQRSRRSTISREEFMYTFVTRQVESTKTSSEQAEQQTAMRLANTDVLFGPSGPTIMVTPDTAVLHGPSGTEIISTSATSTHEAEMKVAARAPETQEAAAVQQETSVTAAKATETAASRSERLVTATAIGSPCGRVTRNIPQGPSAIPTDQLMLYKIQSKAEFSARRRSASRARRVSAVQSESQSKAPVDETPARSTSGGEVSTSRRRSKSIPRVWTARSAPKSQSSSAATPPPDHSTRTGIQAPTDVKTARSTSRGDLSTSTGRRRRKSIPRVWTARSAPKSQSSSAATPPPDHSTRTGIQAPTDVKTARSTSRGDLTTPTGRRRKSIPRVWTARSAPKSQSSSAATPPPDRSSQSGTAAPADVNTARSASGSSLSASTRRRRRMSIPRVWKARGAPETAVAAPPSAQTEVNTARSTSRRDKSTSAARRKSRSISAVRTARSAPRKQPLKATTPPPAPSQKSELKPASDKTPDRSRHSRSRTPADRRTARSTTVGDISSSAAQSKRKDQASSTKWTARSTSKSRAWKSRRDTSTATAKEPQSRRSTEEKSARSRSTSWPPTWSATTPPTATSMKSLDRSRHPSTGDPADNVKTARSSVVREEAKSGDVRTARRSDVRDETQSGDLRTAQSPMVHRKTVITRITDFKSITTKTKTWGEPIEQPQQGVRATTATKAEQMNTAVKAEQSELKTARLPASPGQPGRSAKTLTHTDFFSPTSASGRKPVAGQDKEGWNLARNASSDPAASPRVTTARSRTPGAAAATSKAKSPTTHTAKRLSSTDVRMETLEKKKTQTQGKEIDDMLKARAAEKQKDGAAPAQDSQAAPQHISNKDLVSVQPLWVPQQRQNKEAPQQTSPFTVRTAIKDSMSPTPGVVTAVEETMSPTKGVVTAVEVSVTPKQQARSTPRADSLRTALPNYSPSADVITAQSIDSTGSKREKPSHEVLQKSKYPRSFDEDESTSNNMRYGPAPICCPSATRSDSSNLLVQVHQDLAAVSACRIQNQSNSRSSRQDQQVASTTSPYPPRTPSRLDTPETRTARSVSAQRRRGLFGLHSQGSTPGTPGSRSQLSGGVRLGRRGRPTDSQRGVGTPAQNTPAGSASSRRSRLPILMRQPTTPRVQRLTPPYPQDTSTRTAFPRTPVYASDDARRRRSTVRSGSSTKTARSKSLSAETAAEYNKDLRRSALLENLPPKSVSAESDAPGSIDVKSIGSRPGDLSGTKTSTKSRSQMTKSSRKKFIRPPDSRPSYYGDRKKPQKTNKRSLKKPHRLTDSNLVTPSHNEDHTQVPSADTRSDIREDVRHKDPSPPLKTAVANVDSDLAKMIAEATQNQLQPGNIVIHEQNPDGTFKLELHLTCRMTTPTGRMSISGRAPVGLRPKKVMVNGKEIWVES